MAVGTEGREGGVARRDLRTVFATREAQLVLAAFTVSLLALVVYRTVVEPAYFADLRVYRAEGFAVRHGDDLYGRLPGLHSVTTYPVFAALVFVPTTLMPYAVAAFLVAALNVVAVPVLCAMSFRIAGWERDRALVGGLALATAALWMEPVTQSFGFGQVNLLLLGLVLVDFLPGTRTRGVGVGLAAAMKVTPLIFVVYLLLIRRWRAGLTAALTFLAAQVVSLAADPSGTWRFWTVYLFDVHRVGRLENSVNQTVRGMGVRIEHTRATGVGVTVVVLLVALGGLGCAWLAHRRLGEASGLLACAVTGLLVSPISWSHHWVWCMPLVALLWASYDRRVAAGAAVVFCSFVVWWVPHGGTAELHLTWWQVLLSGGYVYLGTAFLAWTAWRAHRAGPDASRARPTPRSSATIVAH